MIRFRAHFDGEHLTPDEPVDLPRGTPLEVTVEEVPQIRAAGTFDLGKWFQKIEDQVGLIDGPGDWAAEHDRYLAEEARDDHHAE